MIDTYDPEGLTLDQKRKLAMMLYKRRSLNHLGYQPLLDWTIVNRRKIDPRICFDLTKHQYLVGIYDCTDKHIAIMKAGQVGVSEYAISKAFHACDVRQANVFYVMPSQPDVYDFSQMRFGPALEASQYLEDIVVAGNAKDGRRGADRTAMRRIRDSFIVFRGGRVDKEGRAKQLKSVPADIVVRDELDEMDQRVIEISRKRLGHSLIKEELDISTPTFEGFGIHAVWGESDQREWVIPCPHCGRKQFLTIEHFVTEFDDLKRPITWHGMDDGEAWAVCEKCHKQLDRLASGEWVATYPDTPITGFHPTKLHTYHNDPLDIVMALRTTNEERRKEIYNQDLGLPYTPAGARLTDTILDQLKRNYAFGPQVDTRPFAGIDVGKVFHIIIRAPARTDGERPLLFAGEAFTTDEVVSILKAYRVKTAVIDALPETREARKLQAKFPNGTVWLSYYSLSETGSKGIEPWEWDRRKDKKLVNLDRTRTLAETMAGFFDLETNVYPAAIDSIQDYYNHLKSTVRTTRKHGRSGNEVAAYVANGPDHYLHAENYCLVASKHIRKAPKAKT